MRRLLALALVLAALVGLWRSAAIEAALVLADLGAGRAPSLYKTLTPPPERRTVAYAVDGRKRLADLYLPAEKAGAAIVLVPGADRAGKDDVRLVALADTLARARFLVLVPDMPNLRALEVSAADREPIKDAVAFLAAERRPPAIGVAAISYAVAPALLAALEDARVDFVVSVGGVYDLTAVTTFFTTGHYRDGPGQDWRTTEPNAYGKWVFVAANARRMADFADRALLAAVAARKMADPAAAVDDLTARLSPQGRSVMALLDNSDPARVPALIQGLPPAVRDEIRQMDLATRDLAGLKAKLILVHGRDDRIIPWTESAALARMAPAAELVLLDRLAHADLRPGGLADAAALWRAVRLLLAERTP